MVESLLPYLQCPEMGGPLELVVTKAEGDQIHEGWLRSRSGREYPIEQGIPNLVVGYDRKMERTGDQFAFEFLEVGEVSDPGLKLQRDLTLFFSKTGVDPAVYRLPGLDWRKAQSAEELGYEPDFSFFEDKLVVDAGCGDGRFAKLVAPYASEMILLDLGPHIKKAEERTKGLGRVHCVRCNLLHIPLKDEVADFAYSIGVIHHTPSPEGAFGEVGRCVREGGGLSVWVYPPEYWGNPAKKLVSATIRKWLLRKELQDQVAFIRRWLMPIGRFQMKVARYRLSKLLLAPLFLMNIPRHEDRKEMESTVIDYYLPEFIFTLTDQDLGGYFTRSGFSYETLQFPTSGTGRKEASGPGSASGRERWSAR